MFVPKVVSLKQWVERRMGQEVLLHTDGRGIAHVQVTPVGQELVAEKHAELMEKGNATFKEPKGQKRKADRPEKDPAAMCARQRLNVLCSKILAAQPGGEGSA